MARLTKLGKLVDKMLDNSEGWTLYPPQDMLRHSTSGWFLKVTVECDLDFPNFPALTKVDKAALYPKARALKERLQTERTYEAYAADRNKRYRNRKHIYNNIMRSVLGIE